jgi:NAD(P)H dehydrogenase (quinone)
LRAERRIDVDQKARIAIVYYSSTGHSYQVAKAYEEGARLEGVETRVRKVRELASAEAIASNPAWKAHIEATRDVPEVTLDDLVWANGYVFGSPTRFGVMTAQLKQFIDTCGPLWMQGKLANKPVTAFTGAANLHGGQENTIHGIYTVMQHWGAIIVPPGYTDPLLYASGGNPYGVSYTAAMGSAGVSAEVLAAARYMGARLARYAEVLATNAKRLVP